MTTHLLKNQLCERYRDQIAWLSWPCLMFGFVWFYFWGISQGFELEIWVIVVTIINFFVLLTIEQILPRNPLMNALRDPQSLNDIGHGIMQGACKPLTQALSVVIVASLNDLRLHEFNTFWPSDLPFALQFLLVLMIGSFMDYWVHRSFHTFDWMWWFHSIHHDTPQMHLMKSARIHVGEEFINSALKPLPLILLGAPTEIIVFLGMWVVFDGNLSHSNIHQRFPAWAHYILPTVHLHNLHHAKDRKHQDSNYSGSTPVWDILFGTFSNPNTCKLGELGIENSPVPDNFFAQVWYPFKSQIKAPTSSEAD